MFANDAQIYITTPGHTEDTAEEIKKTKLELNPSKTELLFVHWGSLSSPMFTLDREE